MLIQGIKKSEFVWYFEFIPLTFHWYILSVPTLYTMYLTVFVRMFYYNFFVPPDMSIQYLNCWLKWLPTVSFCSCNSRVVLIIVGMSTYNNHSEILCAALYFISTTQHCVQAQCRSALFNAKMSNHENSKNFLFLKVFLTLLNLYSLRRINVCSAPNFHGSCA